MKKYKGTIKTIAILTRGLLILFLLLIFYLAWYQLFYHSPRVDSGIPSKEFAFNQHRNIVTAIRFSPDDLFLISSSVDSTIRIWERSSGRIVREIRQSEAISYMDVSADGQYIVTGNYDSKLRLYRLSDGQLLHEMAGHKGTVWTVAFSNDGKKIASSGDDASIGIWDTESGKLLQKLKGHK